MLITQGKTNWKFLLIVVVLAVIAGGGVLGYLYFLWPKQSAPFSDGVEIEVPEEIKDGPSNLKYEIEYPDLENFEGKGDYYHWFLAEEPKAEIYSLSQFIECSEEEKDSSSPLLLEEFIINDISYSLCIFTEGAVGTHYITYYAFTIKDEEQFVLSLTIGEQSCYAYGSPLYPESEFRACEEEYQKAEERAKELIVQMLSTFKFIEETKIKDSVSNIEIIARENKSDKKKTDIYIKDLKTNREELFVTLADIERDLLDAEFRNGHLFIRRRKIITGTESNQIWKYSSSADEGINLFTSKFIRNFTVSPNENFIAIIGKETEEEDYFFSQTLFFINLSTGEQKRFKAKELITDALLSHREEMTEFTQVGVYIIINKWLSDPESFWGFTSLVGSADPPMSSEASIFKINTRNWSIEKFQIPFEEGLIILRNLNPAKEAILYERVSSGKLVLYIYYLYAQKKQLVISYPAEVFKKYCGDNYPFLNYYYHSSPFIGGCDQDRDLSPKWIDNTTLSYLDFETREEIIKKIW